MKVCKYICLSCGWIYIASWITGRVTISATNCPKCDSYGIGKLENVFEDGVLVITDEVPMEDNKCSRY